MTKCWTIFPRLRSKRDATQNVILQKNTKNSMDRASKQHGCLNEYRNKKNIYPENQEENFLERIEEGGLVEIYPHRSYSGQESESKSVSYLLVELV